MFPIVVWTGRDKHRFLCGWKYVINEVSSFLSSSLQQELFEMEAEIVDLKEQLESGGNDEAVHAGAMEEVTNRLKEREAECDTLKMDKEKLENYLKEALQASDRLFTHPVLNTGVFSMRTFY